MCSIFQIGVKITNRHRFHILISPYHTLNNLITIFNDTITGEKINWRGKYVESRIRCFVADCENPEKIFAESLKLAGKNEIARSTIYLGLGKVAVSSGDNESAQTYLEKALQLNDNNIIAHYYLGKIKITQSPRESEIHLRKVIKTFKKSFWAKEAKEILGELYER